MLQISYSYKLNCLFSNNNIVILGMSCALLLALLCPSLLTSVSNLLHFCCEIPSFFAAVL